MRRELPGDPLDEHSRYLEAAVDGIVVACLYLPNGNPQPGPKFDYKLAWFERFITHAAALYKSGHPVVMAGDYNVVPTDFDIYNPRSWLKDALLQPESRECYQRLLAQGLDRLDPAPASRTRRSSLSGTTSASTGSATRACASTTCCSTPSSRRACWTPAWTAGCAALEKASDHAPAWVTLDLCRLGRKPAARRTKTAK